VVVGCTGSDTVLADASASIRLKENINVQVDRLLVRYSQGRFVSFQGWGSCVCMC